MVSMCLTYSSWIHYTPSYCGGIWSGVGGKEGCGGVLREEREGKRGVVGC